MKVYILREGTIRAVINKVLWTQKERLSSYEVIVIDRLEESGIKRYSLDKLKRLESDSLVLDKEGREVRIPLHRVIALMKNGEVVWQRRKSAYRK
ncbi:MAG TPA: DUF504 domain-containing protein [Acidilobales archaeon]|nr:DUF504 domain-containing protein [Acidilobales archaeon]